MILTINIPEIKYKPYFAKGDINIRSGAGTDTPVLREVSNNLQVGYATGKAVLIGTYLWYELSSDNVFTKPAGFVRHDVVMPFPNAFPGMIEDYRKKMAEYIAKLISANTNASTQTNNQTSGNNTTNTGTNPNGNNGGSGQTGSSFTKLLIPAGIGLGIVWYLTK